MSAIITRQNPPGDPLDEASSSRSIWQRLRDLFLNQKAANLAVAIALVIGFFHGYLKWRYRHPVMTFAFDIPLIIALGLVVSRLRSWSEFFPPGLASRWLRAFYVVVAIWFVLALVLPWGVPFLGALAAVRGWVFATLMFGLGYHIITTRRQFHGYFILIILLATATAIYATRQTEDEVNAMREMDAYFERMTRGQGFVDDEGRYVLRRFSTFVSSGAFGGTMALSLIFLAALLTDRTVGKGEKWILLVLAVIIGWGMFLSGSRTAVTCMALGMALIVWKRKLPSYLWMLGGACAVGLFLGSEWTSGGIVDRYSTLSDTKSVLGRFWVVVIPGWNNLLKSSFIGGGLGKAAVGLPISLLSYFGRYQIWGVDGDLGKAMTELGVVGTLVVIGMLIAGARDGFRVLNRHADNPIGTMALGAVSAFIIAMITFPTGSPFVGIPLGVLTWFFLGGLLRLDQIAATASKPLAPEAIQVPEERRSDQGNKVAAPGFTPAEVSRDIRKRQPKRFLYAPRKPSNEWAPPVAPSEPPPAPKGQGAKKRFLYR
ncbi:MAG: hypothetical protein JNK85_20335 [Verrucomicrobiales bacterium]|nr:hypothetical protein [Verrucomicrobiales bacterium]